MAWVPTVPMSSVAPSGEDLATASAPTEPPAPPRLSTTVVAFSRPTSVPADAPRCRSALRRETEQPGGPACRRIARQGKPRSRRNGRARKGAREKSPASHLSPASRIRAAYLPPRQQCRPEKRENISTICRPTPVASAGSEPLYRKLRRFTAPSLSDGQQGHAGRRPGIGETQLAPLA
jgi:hypothetical protein